MPNYIIIHLHFLENARLYGLTFSLVNTDTKQVFDKVPHKRLCHKLESRGTSATLSHRVYNEPKHQHCSLFTQVTPPPYS